MASTTRYFKVIGHRVQPDGDIEHLLQEVEDKDGTPSTRPSATNEVHVTKPANEQARGTIVKVTETHTRTITLNPQS